MLMCYLKGLIAIRDDKLKEAGGTVATAAGTVGTTAVKLSESKEGEKDCVIQCTCEKTKQLE